MKSKERKEEVLAFWFEILEAKDWFMGGERVDEMLSEKFLDMMDDVEEGLCDEWAETLEGRLALIVVCDQFSRNMFRGTKRSFSYDAKARGFVREALSSEGGRGYLLGEARVLSDSQKLFFFMPLMHSEERSDQELSMKIFSEFGGELSQKEARQHYDLIVRFGRYPHRNGVLGRKNTEEEEAYLADPATRTYGVKKKPS